MATGFVQFGVEVFNCLFGHARKRLPTNRPLSTSISLSARIYFRISGAAPDCGTGLARSQANLQPTRVGLVLNCPGSAEVPQHDPTLKRGRNAVAPASQPNPNHSGKLLPEEPLPHPHAEELPATLMRGEIQNQTRPHPTTHSPPAAKPKRAPIGPAAS